jgi:hypothetical protein
MRLRPVSEMPDMNRTGGMKMNSRMTSAVPKLLQLFLVLCLALALFVPASFGAGEPTPAEVRAIAKEAYIYGYPLVDNYRILYFFTLDKSSPAFKAPPNELDNETRLYTPEDRVILCPNADTLYSGASFDLRTEPYVITLPKIEKNRYYSVQLIDLYTFNFDYLGSRTTGNGGGRFLIVGPGWKGSKPKGIKKVVRSETEIVIAAIRTQLFGPGDMENVKKVQAGYKIQPLSAYLKKKGPAAAPEIKWLRPVSATEQRTSPEFFNELRFILEFCPVHTSEKDLWARFAKIGIVPGKPFDAAALAPEMKAALQAGMADGQKAIDERREAAHGKTTDMFGTREFLKNDFLARAAGAQIGILANSHDEATYISYEKDSAGQELSGKNNYRVRFAPGKLPPARAFWSLTMYDLPGQFLVANLLNRYLINSPMLPNLKKDSDGGLTLYIQSTSPGKSRESNWLPAPAGPFMLMMRIYWPEEQVLNGSWAKPEVGAQARP